MKYTTYNVQQLNRKGKPWQARAKYKDVYGKWKEVSKMLPEAKGKKEATRLAKEWFEKLNAEADLMPTASKAKTIDEIYNEYLQHQLSTGEIERSTYSNSIYSYNKYIKPYLGDYVFATVDKTVLSGWLTKLYQAGYSQNTIHTTYARLKKVYNYFYNNGELLRDPFKGVKMPKKGEAKVTHLNNDQMDNVLSAVYVDFEPQDPMYVGVLLAFYAGLRRGEICGLRWNDIDFYKHTITIRSAVGVGKGVGGDYTKSPKNKSSNRTFPMLPQLEEALKQRKILISPLDSWYVVGNEEEFMRPQQYNRLFAEFVERNGLVDAYGKKIVPHGLRHNFATVGIRAGMDIASLALMMGHTSRAMTLDTYGDANADALTLASVKLKDTMGCRTANGWDVNGFGQLKDGRGNICPVTITLPTLAMQVKEQMNGCDYSDSRDYVTAFLNLLDKKIYEAKEMLIERYKWICSQPSESAKFMYENGLMAGYDGKTTESALKHGTLALGQLGLAEALEILIGCSHTTEYGMEVAKEIESLFKKRCAEFENEYKLNFGVYYSPAENLCYTSMKKFREKYGVIEKVSDHDFFTNSMHIPVWENVGVFKKIDLESQLTGYSSAGCITYVELESSVKHNLKALETVVLYAMEHDIPYFAINVPNDTCLDCGFTDEFNDTCPQCGSHNIQHLRRVTGLSRRNAPQLPQSRYATAFP